MIGKVGSLLSQGVSSVTIPFHPFGGAVDIIVVQQQDGSFKSTPWYVRFGKFQGVLKGAEKLVRIEVNGVEANFHMYLDSAGEAYFIKEVVSDQESEANGSLKDSDNLEGRREDSKNDYDDEDDGRKDNDAPTYESSNFGDGEFEMRDERVTLGMDHLERTESNNARFYEFQDEQSSLDGSVELSEYGSSRYDNLDNVGNVLEPQTSSEVILMSVDGHVLTAPITSVEKNGENVLLNTAQFRRGPGEGTDFCEGDTEFNTGEAVWAAEHLSDLNTSPRRVDSADVCDKNSDNNVSEHQLELCEEDRQHCYKVQEIEDKANEESNVQTNTRTGNTSAGIRRDDVYKSCLELTELAWQDGNVNHQKIDLSSDNDEIAENTVGESLRSPKAINEPEDVCFRKSGDGDGIPLSGSDISGFMPSSDLQVEVDTLEENAPDSDHNCSNSRPTHSDCHDKKPEEQIESGQKALVLETECTKRESMEPQMTPSTEDTSDLGLEISLCRNLLHAGMGSNAAAEAFDANRISEEEYKLSASSIVKNENLVVRIRGKHLPWEKAAPIVLGIAAYGLDIPIESDDAIPIEDMEMLKAKEDDSGISQTPSGRSWRLWPRMFRRGKTLEHTSSNSSNEEVFVDSESGSQNQPVELTPTTSVGCASPHKQLVRTNVPTSDQIAPLNLKEGRNTVTFIFSTRYLGVQKVEAHIYLWKWNARIVVSDVDGTITKSDVLGQVMPLVGKDWTHSGIAHFFSAIKENGYQLLFLSARAIVQAYLTRNFLFNLKQDGKTLPDGPVVISPDGLFPSLYREVIRRAPHEFKIACLEDIKALFPPDHNPFYAGFGNRDTDELSYRKIGIPKGKIFIINPKGEVAVNRHIDVKTYTSLHTLVHDMFPPTSLVEQEDYNPWNYWKIPLPDDDL